MKRFIAIHFLQHMHKYTKFLKSTVVRIKIKQKGKATLLQNNSFPQATH